MVINENLKIRTLTAPLTPECTKTSVIRNVGIPTYYVNPPQRFEACVQCVPSFRSKGRTPLFDSSFLNGPGDSLWSFGLRPPSTKIRARFLKSDHCRVGWGGFVMKSMSWWYGMGHEIYILVGWSEVGLMWV